VSYSLTTANGNGEGKTRRAAQHEAGPIQPAKYALRGCQEPTRGPGSGSLRSAQTRELPSGE